MSYKIKNLLFHPKTFFGELKKEKNYKKTIKLFVIFSLIVYLFWFIKIILQTKNIPFYSGPSYYDFLFGYFGLFPIIYALIFLIFDIIILLIFTLVVTGLAKFICSLRKIKITFRKMWIISVYSLIAWVLSSIFDFIIYFINIESLKYVGHVFWAYYFILLIIGISKNK